MQDSGIITSYRVLEKDPDSEGFIGLEGRVMEICGIVQGEREVRMEVVRPCDEGEKKSEIARMLEEHQNSVYVKEPYTQKFRLLIELRNSGLIMDSEALKVSVECIKNAHYRVEFRHFNAKGGLTTGGTYDAVIVTRDPESGLTTYLAKGKAHQYEPEENEDYYYPIGAWLVLRHNGEDNVGSEEYPIGRFEIDI